MEKKNVTAVIYARVSTNGQDYDRQLNDLRGYASRMGYAAGKDWPGITALFLTQLGKNATDAATY